MRGRSRRSIAAAAFAFSVIYILLSTAAVYFGTIVPPRGSVRIHPINAKPFLTLSSSKSNGDNDKTPILLNAGQGTTGTRTTFETTCSLGIPSFHYLWACVPYQPFFTRQDEYIKQYNRILNQKIILHEKIMECWQFYMQCAHPREMPWWQRLLGKVPVDCTMKRLLEVLEENKVTLNELLNQPGSFSLHDTPYTDFLDYIMHQTITGDATRGLLPRSISLMLTERDPAIWSPRRIQEHKQSLVCKEQFNEIISGNTVLGTNHYDHEKYYYAGAFDVIACIEQASKRNSPPKLVSDVFILYEGLLDICDTWKSRATECHTRLVEINTMAMQDYQDRVRQLYKPEYTINLWDKRLSIAEIAMDMHSKLDVLRKMINRVELAIRGGPNNGKVLSLIHT